MGGDIWLDSQLGVGSSFHFTARLHKQQYSAKSGDSLESNKDAMVETAVEQLRGRRVLLVEDNEINQELVQELLSMNGIAVETACNGAEALEKLGEGDFDGVLMDCQMPVMDGYEATAKIREQEVFSNLPVLAMTANAMKGDKEKVLQAGMNDHIAKPVSPDLMFITMAKWIH